MCDVELLLQQPMLEAERCLSAIIHSPSCPGPRNPGSSRLGPGHVPRQMFAAPPRISNKKCAQPSNTVVLNPLADGSGGGAVEVRGRGGAGCAGHAARDRVWHGLHLVARGPALPRREDDSAGNASGALCGCRQHRDWRALHCAPHLLLLVNGGAPGGWMGWRPNGPAATGTSHATVLASMAADTPATPCHLADCCVPLGYRDRGSDCAAARQRRAWTLPCRWGILGIAISLPRSLSLSLSSRNLNSHPLPTPSLPHQDCSSWSRAWVHIRGTTASSAGYL